jgi:hypothetical protein
MTKALLVIGSMIAVMQTTSAQSSNEDITIVKSDKVIFRNDPKFSCKQIAHYKNSDTIVLSDSVSLKTEKFEFSDAEKVEYNEKTKKMIIYNCRKFSVKGEVIAASGALKGTLEYTLGSDTAYLF